MTTIKLMFRYLLCILLVSCSSVNIPHINDLDHWNNDIKHTKAVSFVKRSVKYSEYPWWHKFNSANLNYFVNNALKKNESIQMAIGNVMNADGELKRLGLSFLPNVNIGASMQFIHGTVMPDYTGTTNPIVRDIVDKEQNIDSHVYLASFQPSYSINLLRQIVDLKSARIGLHAAKIYVDAVRAATIKQVVSLYLLFSASKQKEQYYKHMIDIASKLSISFDKAVRLGLLDTSALIPINNQLTQIKLQLINLHKDMFVIRNNLWLLTGVKKDIYFMTVEPLSKLNNNDLILVSIPAVILQKRPDVVLALDNLKLVNNQINSAYSNFFPQINLTTTAGHLLAHLTDVLQLTSSAFWLHQLSFAMPLLNWQLFGGIKQLHSKYYSAYYHYIQVLRHSFADVENAIKSLQFAIDAYNMEHNYWYKMEQNDHNVQLSYQSGYDSYIQLLKSALSLDSVNIIVLQLQLQHLQLVTNLYYQLAVGVNYVKTYTPNGLHYGTHK